MRGLLVDYGGVLTSSVFASFEAFCHSEGLEPGRVRDLFRNDPDARRLLVDLETGRLDETEFEVRFARRLELDAPGLIDRLFAGMQPDEAMIDAVAATRAAGLVTAMLSNSWGSATRYDRPRMAELFDATVISAQEGMRKPDPRIYALAAQRMGLKPAEIVFVDDLPFNLEPAREMGMAVLRHTDAASTIAALEALLGLRLTRA